MRASLLAFAMFAATLTLTRFAVAGYTHYWKWKVVPDEKRLEACVADIDKLADSMRPILVDRENHTGAAAMFRGRTPFLDAGALPDVAFNGVGADAHETFSFPLAKDGAPSFQFVKTQWKPYDVVVVASLIAARDHFPATDLEITSDGTWEQEWVAGAQLYERVLARKARSPLTTQHGIVPYQPTPGAPPTVSAPYDDEGRAKRQRIGFLALAGAAVIAFVLMRSRE
jgi:hypothetical protein